MRIVSSTRRRLDPVGTRNAILEAAAELFSKKGYDGTSMNDIAAQAKVTKSLLQYHFDTKDNLWTTVMASLFAEFLEHVDRFLASDPTPDRMCELMMSRYQVLEKNPEVLRMLNWIVLSGAPIPDVAKNRASMLWSRIGEIAATSEDSLRLQQKMIVTLAAIDGWLLLRNFYAAISGIDLSSPLTNQMFIGSLMELVWGTSLMDAVRKGEEQ